MRNPLQGLEELFSIKNPSTEDEVLKQLIGTLQMNQLSGIDSLLDEHFSK